MAVLTDFVIVCGLSPDGGFDGAKETDWYHFGIPVQAADIWELQFQCCHKTGTPASTVIGSFVIYNSKGVYQSTTPGPSVDLVDTTAWQQYSFQYQFTAPAYVFPAIWWHAATPLQARYVAAVQMAEVQSAGTVVIPNVFVSGP